MIMASLLVQMTNPRCQMVHREVDEGHRDAMDAHQDHRNRCFGNAIDYSRVPRALWKDGGGVEVCGTKKLLEPLTAARGMSVVMQWTTVEAVTTRLGSHQALRDKQGHFGCAHKAQNLSSKQGCVYRHNTFQTDFSTPWMELVAECIRQERTVKLWMHLRAARAARDAREPYRAAGAAREVARDLAALSKDRPLEPLACPN